MFARIFSSRHAYKDIAARIARQPNSSRPPQRISGAIHLCHDVRHCGNLHVRLYAGKKYFMLGNTQLYSQLRFFYNIYTLPMDTKPWYRGRYDVVRPDSDKAMSRREPELYPAYYLSNRRAESYRYYDKDYGYKTKFDKA